MEKTDLTVPCGEGLINIRVGAVIIKDGKFLMSGDERSDNLYSVGGRVMFGETSEEAIVREVYEETGVKMEVDRLGFVHENLFVGFIGKNAGKLFYEIGFYYYMKVPDDFEVGYEKFKEENITHFTTWVDFDDPRHIYPTFFRSELKNPSNEIKHFRTDERSED